MGSRIIWPAQKQVAEVYNQILSDLNFAEANLPATNAAAAANIANVTRRYKNTAISLKTRVYLSAQNMIR